MRNVRVVRGHRSRDDDVCEWYLPAVYRSEARFLSEYAEDPDVRGGFVYADAALRGVRRGGDRHFAVRCLDPGCPALAIANYEFLLGAIRAEIDRG